MQFMFIGDVCAGMVLARDVEMPGRMAIPLLRENTIITHSMLAQLKQRGIKFIYTREKPFYNIGKKISSLRNTLSGASLTDYAPESTPSIDAKLREQALSDLHDLYSSMGELNVHESSAQIVTRLDRVVGQIVDSLMRDKNALININDLKSYDDYTFHHSLSVAVISIAIAQRLGLSKAQVNQVGMAAMLHDVGKMVVPIEIIQKNSSLSSEEFAVIKEHPPAGVESLTLKNIGDEAIWRGVLYHHEKFDGTGYPHGLKGFQIPQISRIITVADVYDALTSSRPYRKKIQPSEAMEYIMGGATTSFDFDVVEALVKKMELYPVGAYVELSDARIAIVLNTENQARPVVRVDTGEILDLMRDRACRNIVIRRIVDIGD